MSYFNIPEFYFFILKFAGNANEQQDSKLADFIIQMTASLLGVGVALYVYYHGNKTNKEKAANDRTRFEEDKLIYLHQLLTASKRFGKSLINGIEKLIDDVNSDPTKIPRMGMGHDNDIIRLVTKIDQEQYFHAYRNQIPDNLKILDIYNQADLIYAMSIIVKNSLKDGQGKAKILADQFLESMHQSKDLLYQEVIIMYQDDDGRLSQTFNELSSLLSAFNNNIGLSSYFEYETEILTPLRSVILNKQQLYGQDYLLPLYGACVRSSSILDNLIFNNKTYRDSFSDDLVRLKKAHEVLEQSMVSIDNYIERITKSDKP